MKSYSQASKLTVALFVLSLLIFTLRTLYLNQPDIVLDDAYISFRYAENLAQGGSLVFNPNEPVEGYTNFLWTLLLAGCSWLGFEIVTASKVLAYAAGVATLIILYLFSLRLFKPGADPLHSAAASLPCLLFATLPSQARYVVSGMETLLFTALLAAAVYLLLYSKYPALAGMVFAFTAMTRPEGLLYFALAAGYGMLFAPIKSSHKYGRLQFLLVFGASFLMLYAPYFIWRYNYYGYLLPNTFYAKAAGFHIARLKRGWSILIEVSRAWASFPLYLLALGSLVAIRKERIWLLFAALLGSTLAYFVYVGGDFVVWFGPRFLMPVLPFLLLAATKGLLLMTSLPWNAPRIKSGLLALASLGLLVTALWFSWPARFDRMQGFAAQMRSWKELGIWMKTNLPADTTVAVDAAGLIPFYSGLYSIDMFGLADLHIAHLKLQAPGSGITAHEKFDVAYILARNPDCIVSSWVDLQGIPTSAGLEKFADQILANYDLRVLSKVRYGAPADGRWIIETDNVTPETHQNGYHTGLFCQKTYP